MSESKNKFQTSPFGEFLVENNYITPEDLARAVVTHAERNPKLGILAQQQHLLTYEKICAIMEYQRRRKVRFGQAAVELGFLSDPEVEDLLEKQAASSRKLGEILVELAILDSPTLDRYWDEYNQLNPDLHLPNVENQEN